MWFASCRLAVAGASAGSAIAATSARCAVAGTAGATAALTAAAGFGRCRGRLLNLAFIVLLHVAFVLFVFVERRHHSVEVERLSIKLTHLLTNHYTAICMKISGRPSACLREIHKCFTARVLHSNRNSL